MVFLEQLGVDREAPALKNLLKVGQHALANAGDEEDFFGVGNQVSDTLRKVLDGLSGIAVRADAEGILAIDFEQVSSFVQQVRDGLVVHGQKTSLNKLPQERKPRDQARIGRETGI